MKIQHKRKLSSYVRKQMSKFRIVDQSDLDSMCEGFSIDEIVRGSDMTEDELIDAFRLSFITESLTDQYADTYNRGSALHGAEWLKQYINGFWVPDENGHADPFKNVLIDFGVDQSILNRDIADAKDSVEYSSVHASGFHPIALTTYGMIQECITDYWYELQRNFFPATSNTSKVISKVKGREALHTIQFRDFTALQLEFEPYLLPEIVSAAVNFKMPANHIPTISSIEAKTTQWIPRMNGNVLGLLKRIIDNINIALDDRENLGRLVLEYASISEKRFLDLVPNRFVVLAISRMRGGYGIVGEVILEQLGLTVETDNIQRNFGEELEFRLRCIIKRWIMNKMEIEGFILERDTDPDQLGVVA